MNDPIKDFVDQHREDFDHLEAPLFDLAGLKAKLAQNPTPEKTRVLSIKPARWVAAAAVLLVIASGFWFFNRTEGAKKPEQHLAINKGKNAKKTDAKPLVKVITNEKKQVQFATQKAVPRVKKYSLKNQLPPIAQLDPIFNKQLNDSTSSSTRLAAVLAIKKSGFISYDLLDRLANTIQNDRNSNVRLAALSILEKYQQDAHVSNLLVKALNHQDDPMVQLSLVNLLGRMQHIKIDEQLYALVNDPSTMEAVKDEAYQILLKENKF
ncbi:hypothetical protein GJU39_11860 [Pedobacter petrophilus]|uniref:HEAT repeat domain-containing protein n=1 Tax=Pedobacter petrophilus TaxID=1908241 RepID=A0A7K0FYX2_9SPHI|nr:HEAT repeat domain-containing protein [Pedobacter petrophilus]MRX76783.1 hypothetical protein [Pedobacter petrophilus]